MTETTRAAHDAQNPAAKLGAIADARAASDAAAHLAHSAANWASYSDLALDDAAEVWAAAARARTAAEAAELAPTADEAWNAARAAWAAVTSAQEADARMNTVIAESLTHLGTAA
jgi:hypothetical protein